MNQDKPYLSVIVPSFRGADYVVANIEVIRQRLTEIGKPFEIIVVSDGCSETAAAAMTIEHECVRTLSYSKNRGKGHAIAYGITHAHGRLIGWLDSDLDIDPGVIIDAVAVFDKESVDAVIGSKRHPESSVYYPWYRRVLSWGFQTLVAILLSVKTRDTQVGAKVFRRETLSTIAPLLLVKRYAFDLEVLTVAAQFGFDRVREVPVSLSYRFTGTGITHKAVWMMFIDTLALAYRVHIRHWYVRQFAAFQRERGDLFAELSIDQLPDMPVITKGSSAEVDEPLTVDNR